MKKKLIFIIGVCLCAIIIIALLLILLNKKHYVINKSVAIAVGGYNQVVSIKTMDTNVKLKGKYEGVYVKLDMEIENKKNIDSVTALHQFTLVDKNNEVITECYHDSILPNSNLDDVFPKIIKANTKTNGYLYCPTDSIDISKLKITVISGGKIEEDQTVYEYADFYIDIKK